MSACVYIGCCLKKYVQSVSDAAKEAANIAKPGRRDGCADLPTILPMEETRAPRPVFVLFTAALEVSSPRLMYHDVRLWICFWIGASEHVQCCAVIHNRLDHVT